jgi:hypothetical protein
VGARLEYLRAKSLSARAGSPFADKDRSITVVSPDGMPIHVLETLAS